MNMGARVMLTDTSIAIVSSRDVLMTSIPLRTWVRADGIHWISRLRRPHEVKHLVRRLSAALLSKDHHSVMERISEVMNEDIPSAPERDNTKPEQAQKKIIRKVNKSSSSQLMGGTRPPRRRERVNAVALAQLANPMIRSLRGIVAHVR